MNVTLKIHPVPADVQELDEVWCLIGNHFVASQETVDNPHGQRACLACLEEDDTFGRLPDYQADI